MIRDAIHVCTLKCKAGEILYPSQPVAVCNGLALPTHSVGSSIGILDPFKLNPAPKGTEVTIFIYPDTITDMKHVWTHPVLDLDLLGIDAETWLKEFANKIGVKYEKLLTCDRETLHFNDTFAQDYYNENRDLFTKYFKLVTGRGITELPFRCAC